MVGTEFIDPKTWYVYDGAHIYNNCTKLVPYQFSYNAGGMILGAAAMYNYTESQVWKDRLDNLLEGAKVFFTGPQNNIMTEVACESVKLCNLDQKSFKAYLSRWLAVTTQWAPHTREFIMPLLRASAVAATDVCTGGDNGQMCSLYWTKDTFEGDVTVGQQMAALEVTLACMIQDRPAPLTKDTGGTSKPNPGGGSADIGRTIPDLSFDPLPAGDKAGAAIITVLAVTGLLAFVIWIFLDETSDSRPIDQFRNFGSSTTAAVTALAAGRGAAAVLGHQKRKDIDEKNSAVFQSNDSSEESNNRHIANDMPVYRSASHSQTHGHRRVSSMPLGWPQHTNRASATYDADGIYPAPNSERQSRGDWAAASPTPNSVPSSSIGGRGSYVQQDTLTDDMTPDTNEAGVFQDRMGNRGPHGFAEAESVQGNQRRPSGTIGVAQ